jgi:dUTP pyrophosphatase
MKVPTALLPGAKAPTYATDGSSAFDLYFHRLHGKRGDLNGTTSILVGTGVKMAVPKGHVLLLFSRSGLGIVHQINLTNCVGVIDSDYTGEIKAGLSITSNSNFLLAGSFVDSPRQISLDGLGEGDRICQGIILPCPKVEFDIVETLPTTARGSSGLGSTGE